MNIDSYGLISLSSDEIFDLIYNHGLERLKHIQTDNETAERFHKSSKSNGDGFECIETYKEPLVDIKAFDNNNQKNWYMPDQYKNLDIEKWLLEQCQNKEEILRVKEELELFGQYKMIDMLKFLKYLVDTMRSNQIVWGVGRGSSVASFCLFLIGTHKINSLIYNLDIREFLK